MKKRWIITLCIVLAAGFCFQTPVFAQDIKARFKARLPVINSLKSQGIIGENNRGFLDFRGPQKNAGEVNAENADRREVYQGIAAKQGTSADLVGKRRAMQLRDLAKPGEWLQDDSGKWYKK